MRGWPVCEAGRGWGFLQLSGSAGRKAQICVGNLHRWEGAETLDGSAGPFVANSCNRREKEE